MKFNFENGEWVEGEKPKKRFNSEEFFDKWKYCFFMAFIDLLIWWINWGVPWLMKGVRIWLDF